MTITIKDATLAGKVTNEVRLTFAQEWVTVREIISERVTQEVDTYNNDATARFKGLIEPAEAEQALNTPKTRRWIDAEKQVYVALNAFQQNGFFVLIDDIQAEHLEQRVKLSTDTDIAFLKLTPLVGG